MKNYGFHPEEIEILPEDWKFGARSDKTILQSSGQWADYLPTFEPQADKYETSGCTSYGTLNQVETLMKGVFDLDLNYSDRYNYILASITLSGGPPKKVYESIRKKGLIDDAILPYSDTYREFVTPSPMSKKYLHMGQKWLNAWELHYEWVASRDKSKMKAKIIEALQYSPIAVSVTAWHNKDGVYINNGQSNNHWCLCYGYEMRDGEVYLKIFDSYDHSKKVLHKDHITSFAMRISIKKAESRLSFWQRFLIIINNYE